MRPVLVFRFSRIEGPGYLGEFLTRKGILWTQVNVDAGDSVPEDINGHAGLVLMGGPMSVNDDLPWIPGVLDLIRQAVGRGIPVLGHCLGGQLMSRALGGTVGPNPVKEIGWGSVSKVGHDPAPDWLGGCRPRSRCSSGTAKPSPFPKAPSACWKAPSAPTRPSCSTIGISACNATSK